MIRHPAAQSSATTRRRPLLRLVPILLLAGLLAATDGALPLDASPAPASGSASLIYAGWFGNTIPTPSFVQANLAFLQSQPFDGLVVYLRDPGLTANVTTTVMTNTPVSYQTAMWVMSPVVGLSFTTLTQNLGLIQGSTPPDFFDDWSVPIQNFANVAKAAKDSGLKGLCFDNEQYFAPWGDYGGQTKYAATKSLAEYQAQARLRGKQVMEAMTAQFPDIAVITLHGPYVSEPDAPPSLEFPQWQSGNELLGPFFSGFMEGAGDTACNMDGGELYTLRTAAQFAATYNWCKNDLPSAAVDCAFIPPALRTVWPGRSCISFGVYDCPFGGAGMDPTILRSTLANALRQADRYVWFYAEASTYLLPPALGGAADAWVNAIRLARTDAGTGAALTAPANLAGQAVSTTEISLTWEDRSSNETGIEVERKTGSGGTWSLISTLAADATSFNDPGRTPGTVYVFRVRAVNASGASAYSNEASVTTSGGSQIPSPPSNLAATAVTSTSVTLGWTDGSSNENGFSIEGNTGGSWTQIGWVPDNVTAFTHNGLNPNTSYSYRVLAFNGAGNSATTNQVSVTTPQLIQIPGAPSNLAATAVISTSVTLGWMDGSSNENGFSIERNIAGSWTQIGWVPDNVTTFSNSGLDPGTSYSYRVLAFNGAGNSATTNQVTVTTPPILQIPSAPSNLRMTAVTTASVTLAWTDGSSNENGFSIERNIGGSWTQIGWVPDNVTAFSNSGLSPNTTYSYRVLAFNGAGNSAATNQVTVTTQSFQLPAAPSSLRVTGVTSTSVTLAWTDGSSNENGFSIERRIGGSWVQIGWVADNVTTFRHAGLSPNRTYSYRVKAFNAAGNSAASNKVSATTPAP
jgi:hypothetical protein